MWSLCSFRDSAPSWEFQRIQKRQQAWAEFGIIPRELRAVMNGRTVYSTDCTDGDRFDAVLTAEPGWFRFELWGDALSDPARQLVLTSPFYCR